MIARAGELHEANIALEHDDLGGRRYFRKAKPRRHLARIHNTRCQRGLFDVLNHEHAEVIGIGEGALHDRRIGDGTRGVGHGGGTGLLEQADLGDLTAFEALGDGCHRNDADDGGIAGAAQDKIDDRGIIDYRNRCSASRSWW